MKALFKSICQLLKFEVFLSKYGVDSICPSISHQHLNRLACAAADCVCAFSVCTLLQTQLFQAGVIWQLLPHLFRFDWTLDEGGSHLLLVIAYFQ
jgi:hypothetical protein